MSTIQDQKIGQFCRQFLTDKTTNTIKSTVVQIKYPSQSKYVGQVDGDHGQYKHGYGIYYYYNGQIYMGKWVNDQFHGYGTYLFNNGEVFQGQFRQGEGIRGVYYYNNGNKYKGDFFNSQKNGYGALIYNDQFKSVYQGEWSQGQRHGKGKFSNRQMEYIGQWKHDIASGRGKYTTPHVNYEGIMDDWLLREGKIKIDYNRQQFYQGDITNGIRQGLGVYQFAFDSFYRGQFHNDQINGNGKLTFNNGVYQGKFKNGFRDGYGQYQYKNGDRYLGDWKQGLRHGQGQLQYANGDIYQGTFWEDLKHGKGIYRHRSNTGSMYSVYEGDFYQDKRHGTGKYSDHGFTYEGEFFQDKMHGIGLLNGKRVQMHFGDINSFF